MNAEGSWLSRLASRWGADGRRRWLALGLVAAGLAGAAVWLAVGRAGPVMVDVGGDCIPAARLAEAQAAISAEGIGCRIESGRLLAPSDRAAAARQVIQRLGLGSPEEGSLAEQFTGADSLWTTQSELQRRWQAAKMTVLARAIRRFPSVRSASVILEEGGARSIGGTSSNPTASVAVEMVPGSAMTPELVDAIADLVSGSVSGMRRQDVRIVDEGGRSHRSLEAELAGDESLQRLLAAESYYARRIRSALSPLSATSVVVTVGADGSPPPCRRAWVFLAASQLSAFSPRQGAGADSPAGEPALGAEVERLRQRITRALGCQDPPEVVLETYDDLRGAALTPAKDRPAEAGGGWGLALWSCGALVAVAAAGWACRSRLRRRRRPAEIGNAVNPSAAPLLGVPPWASAQDILDLLKGEHPQTIAVVLSGLDSDRAASVLAGLPPEVQLEVSRRIAGVEALDEPTMGEVYRVLAGRLAELASRRGPAGGVKKLAELLHRAGAATEQRVVQSLGESAPAASAWLGDSQAGFEDLGALEDDRLAPALESVDARKLAVAMRTSSAGLCRRILACLSPGAAGRLRAEMDRVGAVRLSDVEAAQQGVVDELRQAGVGLYEPAGEYSRTA